jgi:hypothetical protein
MHGQLLFSRMLMRKQRPQLKSLLLKLLVTPRPLQLLKMQTRKTIKQRRKCPAPQIFLPRPKWMCPPRTAATQRLLALAHSVAWT